MCSYTSPTPNLNTNKVYHTPSQVGSPFLAGFSDGFIESSQKAGYPGAVLAFLLL
jgi:hypothetical protein